MDAGRPAHSAFLPSSMAVLGAAALCTGVDTSLSRHWLTCLASSSLLAVTRLIWVLGMSVQKSPSSPCSHRQRKIHNKCPQFTSARMQWP